MKNLNVRNEEIEKKGGKYVKNNRFANFLVLILVICILTVSIAHDVYAATTDITTTGYQLKENLIMAETDNNGTWTYDDSGTVTGTAKGSLISKKATTLTITNNSDKDWQISFDVTLKNANSFTINNTSVSSGASYSTKLEAKTGKMTIYLQSKSGLSNTTATATLSNFTVGEPVSESITLLRPASGSYTVWTPAATKTKSITVSSTDEAESQTFSLVLTDGIYVEATPADGTFFSHWTKNGNVYAGLAEDDKIAIPVLESGDEVGVVFSDMPLPYTVGSRRYSSWNEAVTAANNANNKTIVISQDYTLPATETATEKIVEGGYVSANVKVIDGKEETFLNYLLPEGVKLLVPKSTSDTGTFSNEPEKTNSVGDWACHRTLQVEANATITVRGAINVNGTAGVKQPYGNVVTGSYGCILLEKNAEIVLEGGANLYCYGYIAGDGQVTAKSQSSVYELFQYSDWPGGSITTAWMNAKKNLDNQFFVVSQYYIQNVEADLRLEAGSKSIAINYIYATVPGLGTAIWHGPTEATLISNADALFNLSSGYILRQYNSAADRIAYNMYGDMATGGVTVSLGSAGSVNSTEYVLALNGNMDVNIQSGKSIIGTSDLALLPGAKVYIASNAEVEIAEGGSVYIFDVQDWNQGLNNTAYMAPFDTTHFLRPIRYTYANKTTEKRSGNTVSGQIQVDGTLIANSNLFVTQHTKASGNGVNTSADKVLYGTGTFENREVDDASIANINPYIGYVSGKNILGKNEYSVKGGDVKVIPAVGIMHGADYSASTTGKYESFGEGTYRAHPDNTGKITDTWYKHCITYQFVDAQGNKILDPEVRYISIGEDSLALDEIQALPEGYVISGVKVKDSNNNVITVGDNVSGSPNKNVADGWLSLSLSIDELTADFADEVPKDLVVELTLKEYDHIVTFTKKNAETGEHETVASHYVADTGSTTLTLEGQWDFTDPTPKASAGSNTDATYSVAYGEDPLKPTTLLTINNVDKDVVVAVDGVSRFLVTWNLTGDYTDTRYEWVSGGESSTTNMPTADDRWYIVDTYSARDNTNVDITSELDIINDKQSVTVKNVSCGTTITLKVDEYKYKILLTGGSDSADGSILSFGPFYTNEKTYTISDDVVDKGYIFAVVNSIGPKSIYQLEPNHYVQLSKDKDSLTINDLSSALTTITASFQSFDYTVTWQSTEEALEVDYVKSGFGASYTVPTEEGKRYVATGNDQTGETIAVENVTTHQTIDVSLYEYQYKVTFTSDNREPITKYALANAQGKWYDVIAGSSSTIAYQAPNNTVITAYTPTPDVITVDAKANVNSNVADGWEVLRITELESDVTVDLTLGDYAHKVTWQDKATQESLEVDYVQNNGEASYTAAENHVVVGEGQTGETITVKNVTGNKTVVLTLYEYDYKVTFTSGTDADGNPNVLTTKYAIYNTTDQKLYNATEEGNKPLQYAKDNVVITDYYTEATITVDKGNSPNSDKKDGWEVLIITGIESNKKNVTVELTLAKYDYRVKWIVNTNTETGSFTETHYVTGKTDNLEIAEGYTITEVTTNQGTGSYEGNVATVTGINGDATVTVTAQDYKYKITWIVDGVEQEPTTTNEDTVVWTLPDSTDDKTYVVVNAESTIGTGIVDFTNKTVTVTPKTDMTVKITTEEALTNYTALWGDMSFRYYKNAAYFGWDGEAYQWRLIEQYAWTHKTGSMIHAYADLDNPGEIKHYKVPNGSVMIVNPTNQKITATVTITVTNDPTVWSKAPYVTLIDEDGNSAVTTITVTLDAHETLLVKAELTGTPIDHNLTDFPTGSYSVEINPID